MKSHSLPTVEAPRDFYLGGLYSVALFALITLVFYQLLIGVERIHSYALKKSSAVTVSLSELPIQTSKTQNEPKPLPQPEKEVVSQEQPSAVEDISSLFSNVKTEKIVRKKRAEQSKTVDTNRIASLQTRLKKAAKRAPSATAEKVKKLSLVRPSVPGGGAAVSGGEEVNRYYAKIQAIIYDNFFPPANSEGAVAKIRIWLSPSGRLKDFKVIRHSGEPLFDREVSLLEKRLKTVTFERNPQEKETVLDVSLISKE